jgi:glyoxylase-like metal-dependent hydrolase (beta-lactamase superfamily II)
MTMQPGISRRGFLYDLGRGTMAVAVFGLAACTDVDESPDIVSTSTSNGAPTPNATDPVEPPSTQPTDPGPVSWRRVNLGFVSAYIVARGGEAAIVDTGVENSQSDIGAGLTALGLDWEAVGHVCITHRHGDHQGSLPAVMAAAAGATGYAGAGDLAAITSPRPLVSVGDGDKVFDLEIIETPGHTPGHISVLSTDAGLLIAGDALNSQDGGVIGANPQFSSDMATANLSVKKLAGYQFDTVVFGHGEPVIGGAAALVAELAAST